MIPADLPRGGWTALMYAARAGRARGGEQACRRRRRSESQGSRRLDRADSRHHQRPLRPGEGAAGQGRGPEHRRHDRHDAALCGRRHAHGRVDAGPAAAQAVERPRQRRHREGAARQRREPQLPVDVAAAPAGAPRGDGSLGAGSTPFMRAAKWGDMTMMRLLLDNGADPTLPQKNHTTALMIAAGVGKRRWRQEDPRHRGTEQDAIAAIKLCIGAASTSTPSTTSATPPCTRPAARRSSGSSWRRAPNRRQEPAEADTPRRAEEVEGRKLAGGPVAGKLSASASSVAPARP